MKEFIEKLIGRLEEKQKIETSFNFNYFSAGVIRGYRDAISTINKLSEEYINCSTDTSTGWIIVMDSLPSDEKEYLVTLRDGEVTSAKYDKKKKMWVDTVEEYYEYPVIAWQPLPAPYKEGVTENE